MSKVRLLPRQRRRDPATGRLLLEAGCCPVGMDDVDPADCWVTEDCTYWSRINARCAYSERKAAEAERG